jgi:WD40-like Beta Propeller Repeat
MQGFDWSPDGSGQIVFSAEGLGTAQCQNGVCRSTLDIYLVDTATGSVRNLSNTDSWAGPYEDQPAWSPDGTHIAYRAAKLEVKAPGDVRTTPTSIWIMNADGSDQHQVSEPPTGDPDPLTDSDNVPTWQPCRPNVTTDCSAKSRSTNAATTPTTKVTPLTTGTFGVNCGVDKFDWYDATLDEMPERKGAESCIFLLSNSDAVEVLDKVLASSSKDATLTSMFGDVILAAAKSVPNAPLAAPGEPPLPTGFRNLITDSVKEKITDGLEKKGWHLLASDIPGAIEAMDMIESITNLGQAVGLAAVPIVGTFIIGEIQDDEACVQLDATVADKKLHVDWHLVYNPDALSDPRADKGLTETWAASREVRSFAPDKLQSHGAAFACDGDGNVRMIGTGSGIFEHPTHVVT